MCSIPPATTTSHAPRAISPAPAVTAVRAPAHILSIANPGTLCGMPASSATSRPSVRPWSPTCAVAARMTSPIRSGSSCRFRRSSSLTALTPMSSARVRQKTPFSPARPNAVRTPSTKTTSRPEAMSASLRGRRVSSELLAELGQVLAVGLVHLAAVLDECEARHRELARLADVQQLAQRAETVARCVDGVRRLVVVRVVVLALRQVRQVRDDDLDGLRHGVEQISFEHVHAVGDTVSQGVLAGDLDSGRVYVRREDLHLRRGQRDGDPDHAGAGTDVGDSDGSVVDAREGGVDERLGRGARREDATGRSEELEPVKGRLGETRVVADWDAHFGREAQRYRDGESRLPEAGDADARQRQLTRMGNAAAGAGLSLLMQGNTAEARDWFDRASNRYRESWADAPPGSWGRPIGVLKAHVLAGDWAAAERGARWTLAQGADDAPTPIGRYAAAFAHAVLREWDDLRIHADALRQDETFPQDVAETLAAVASPGPIAFVEAVESVLESFETREAYLEDLPAADTVLVLQALAERRDIAPAELESELLP